MGNKLKRILHSPLFSLVVLVILVGCLGYIAYSVTESYKIEPDFGGMVISPRLFMPWASSIISM